MPVDIRNVKPEYNGMTLLEYRQEHGMTQEEMALLLGVEQSLYSRWEHGRVTPSLRSAARILEATENRVTIVDLIRTSDDAAP